MYLSIHEHLNATKTAKPFNSDIFKHHFYRLTDNYLLLRQVWGESGAWVHLSAACKVTWCRQNHGNLRARRQPHRGPKHILPHLEGGELQRSLWQSNNLPVCFLFFHCKSLFWPVGVTCVLWLWTWGEICPLPAQTEEQVHGGVLPHTVRKELSDCQTSQNQLIVWILLKTCNANLVANTLNVT